MLNLRNNIIMKGAILTIFLLITGVFVAVATVNDHLETSWTGSGIEAKAWDLMDEKYYQIRYYQPGTLPVVSESYLWSDETDANNDGLTGPYDDVSNPDGFHTNPKFLSGVDEPTELDPHIETLTYPGVNGWYFGEEWTIVLMKGGSSNSDPLTYANSLRVNCHAVPIPEFSTIALPIAAIIGIMFMLHSRRRKED